MPGLKQKTIADIIQKKLDKWLATLPADLRLLVRDHIIVTGGCIASMLLGEKINDYDLYCDSSDVSIRLANYYVAEFNKNRAVTNPKTKVPYVNIVESGGKKRATIYIKSAGIAGENEDGSSYDYFESQADSTGAEDFIKEVTETGKVKGKDYRPVFLSENAITLSNSIQIVIRFTGSPDEIHENYDYAHTTNYYYTGTKRLVLRNTALMSLLAKNLVYTGSLYPICSLFRMRKFLDRGWKISAGEITKMALQISKLDLSDVDVLRTQLIGVDAAFFRELLWMLEDYNASNEKKPIDSSYVIQLIDQLADQ